MTLTEWTALSSAVSSLESKIYLQRMAKDSPELQAMAALLKALVQEVKKVQP